MEDWLTKLIHTIEGDPGADWSLEAAARSAGYSPFHFHRLFKAATGITLSQFVRGRQMLMAARLVLQETRLEDIADRFHYSTPEAFSRSFKAYTGKNPAEFRLSPIPLPEAAVPVPKGVIKMKSKIMELKQDILVVGVQVQTSPPADLNITVAWKGLTQRWQAIGHKAPNPRTFGLQEYRADERTRCDGIGYVACVEVTQEDPLPTGTVLRRIPAGAYAVFTHVGPTETLDQSFRHIYTQGLADLGHMPAADFDLEAYDGRFREDDPASELDIWVPVK